MKGFKRALLPIVWVIEVASFGYLFVYGAQGSRALAQQLAVNDAYRANIEALKLSVHDLAHEVHAWETDPFFKEKVAREQLQMARPGETILYCP